MVIRAERRMAGTGHRLAAEYLVAVGHVAGDGEVVEAAVEALLPELLVRVEVWGLGTVVVVGVGVEVEATARTGAMALVVTRQKFGGRLDEGGGGGVGRRLDAVPHC